MDDSSANKLHTSRGASKLGWLVGPAIVVAVVLVVSGCDGSRAPATEHASSQAAPVRPDLKQLLPQPSGLVDQTAPG